MNIDYATWRFWWDIVQTAATLLVGAYVWFVNRDRVTNSRITALRSESDKRFTEMGKGLDARLDKHSERLVRVEAVCGHQPNHGDLSKVYDRINALSEKQGEMGAGVANLQGEMQAILRQLNLINEHLINRDRG